MHLVQILLPRADNKGTPFDREPFDQLKQELAARYGGVTAYVRSQAEGLWKTEGAISSDDVILFEVMAEVLDQGEWTARRQRLERLFRQDHIIIRHMPIILV